MTSNNFQHNNLDFLSGGGEMGALTRAYPWAETCLGEAASWPQSLKTVLRLLLSSGHPMFIWWGPELVQFYNDAYSRFIGSELHPSGLGKGGRECWRDVWNIVGPQINQVMSGGGATWHENQRVSLTRNGKLEDSYWTYSYNPIDDPLSPKGVGGVLVICSETTSQVLAEQRRKVAEERWRELFTQAPSFMCILNGPEHIFEFANPKFFELVGNRDLIGKPVVDAMPEAVSQGFVELLDQVYSTGIAYRGMTVPVVFLQSGSQYYLDFVYQPVRNVDGQVTGIFVDGYDVTERTLASQILHEQDRRKDEFLAMLAHELRNPLAPIRNASEMLLQIAPADSRLRATGELISRQVTQLTHLVDDLLDVSRITQGRIELQREPLELNALITSVLESLHSSLNEKNHQLSYLAEVDKIFINGDSTRIIQCLSNVLNNAIKYTDVGGKIAIKLYREKAFAVIDLADNGVGIAALMLPRVFDLFVQADQTLDRSQGGLGIGLSIVRRLVQMHGGTITVFSEGVGQGARFKICLPVIEPPAQLNLTAAAVPAPPLRLLIVDDNVDAANSLALLLELKGHQTTAAYNGREALQRLQTFTADIVLLDIGLPDIDGYEVARQIGGNMKSCALIALTGYGQAEDILRAKEAGFTAHITKPIVMAELERILAQQGSQLAH
ncbi:MAG TPA: ATP-binding protein [Cellvibrio sp.]|nr:ATP-binding protein [Cellvibrio sp.]